MRVVQDPARGPLQIQEQEQPILQYQFRTVEPGDLLSRVAPANLIYARPRSDYLHPLHGPHGEILTRDWPVDHPHHRGIYWAWPEVGYQGKTGDLHALQHVFARPQGEVQSQGGPNVARIDAENLWWWEDQVPIVREWAIIRAHRATPQGRAIDLEFQFIALAEGVTLARRDTRLYGGLNVRLATPTNQTIQTHLDPSDAQPRRAWSDLSGKFDGTHHAGLMILQHRDNPEYPGDWIQYPELSWCQPTFPTAGTRFSLRTDQTLTLRYRLWIHDGPAPSRDAAQALWDAYHASVPGPGHPPVSGHVP